VAQDEKPTTDEERRDAVLRRMLATPKRPEPPQPVGHVVTPAERRTLAEAVAVERPRPPPRTADIIKAELVEAQTALGSVKDAFDRYSGNNPRKYQSEIRRAADAVRRLKGELEALEAQRKAATLGAAAIKDQ
jgi:acyl-CoA reductase-like NAD-dependent aldehyde dehydrogenase